MASSIIHSMGLDQKAFHRVRHPLDKDAEVEMAFLSDLAGMQRNHVRLARLQPGKKSFPLHSHAVQEEWIYILSGSGQSILGNEREDVGPGDYIGYPTDGRAHTLINTSDQELLYLMGGERTDVEVASFPELGKTMIGTPDQITLSNTLGSDRYTVEEWIARALVKDD